MCLYPGLPKKTPAREIFSQRHDVRTKVGEKRNPLQKIINYLRRRSRNIQSQDKGFRCIDLIPSFSNSWKRVWPSNLKHPPPHTVEVEEGEGRGETVVWSMMKIHLFLGVRVEKSPLFFICLTYIWILHSTLSTFLPLYCSALHFPPSPLLPPPTPHFQLSLFGPDFLQRTHRHLISLTPQKDRKEFTHLLTPPRNPIPH